MRRFFAEFTLSGQSEILCCAQDNSGGLRMTGGAFSSTNGEQPVRGLRQLFLWLSLGLSRRRSLGGRLGGCLFKRCFHCLLVNGFHLFGKQFRRVPSIILRQGAYFALYLA